MRALVMGAEQQAALTALQQHAASHPIIWSEMLQIARGAAPPVGARPGYSCDIPHGYRVAFSIEDQPKGRARHLSVSIHPAKKGKCAHPEAVNMLMAELGFRGRVGGEGIMLYTEHEDTVINVIEYM